MGDENPIRTLGDYFKPSHEGYRNTIELPAGNNVNGGLVKEIEKSPLGRNLLRNSSVDSILNHTEERMKLDGRNQKVIFHSWIIGNWNNRYVDNSVSCNNEWKESKYENPPNTAIDSFFKAYDVRDIEIENRQEQTKYKDNKKDDMRPHKKIWNTEKFEAIKYLLGPNEE
ncbi:hypothetical protein Tco_0747579 [Tanacetum coccineum]|uniref:Uncharacterized protein n=1 Tax=Tanacetum coccineum TaxID=301880 RepID=A0ABQ4YWL8_9ASTR